MAKRLLVYPYKMGSKSGKLLSSALECKRVYPDRDYTPKPNDVIINWGSGFFPVWRHGIPIGRVINHWTAVCNAVHKGDSFRLFSENGVRMPGTTKSKATARSWLEDEEWVVGRQTLEGKDGDGIVLIKKEDELVPCQLYTKYIKKATEYRVYVVDGVVIDCLEKRRDSDLLEQGKVHPHIRTERNGWVFCRSHVNMPEVVGSESVKAIAALGLNFGGVDVVFQPQHNRAFVLEVNTAPSIFGPSVRKFAEALRTYAEKL